MPFQEAAMARCRVSANDDRVHQVLSTIKQDPSTTVQRLARLVNLSSSRLGHLFKAQTGNELRHYLLDARLEKAAELLRKTEMQIKAISHLIGYHHVASFDRVFRKKFKLPPADYRRQQLSHASPMFIGVLTGSQSPESSEKG